MERGDRNEVDQSIATQLSCDMVTITDAHLLKCKLSIGFAQFNSIELALQLK